LLIVLEELSGVGERPMIIDDDHTPPAAAL
jgi:hypothetical protein